MTAEELIKVIKKEADKEALKKEVERSKIIDSYFMDSVRRKKRK